jgi:excisionase family DNA binding protein
MRAVFVSARAFSRLWDIPFIAGKIMRSDLSECTGNKAPLQKEFWSTRSFSIPFELADHIKKERYSMPKEYFSIDEVAERLGCSANSVRNLIHRGRLNAVRIGSGEKSPFRIHQSHLDAFLSEQSINKTQLSPFLPHASKGRPPSWLRADFA